MSQVQALAQPVGMSLPPAATLTWLVWIWLNGQAGLSSAWSRSGLVWRNEAKSKGKSGVVGRVGSVKARCALVLTMGYHPSEAGCALEEGEGVGGGGWA